MEGQDLADKRVPDIQAGKTSEVPVCGPEFSNPVKPILKLIAVMRRGPCRRGRGSPPTMPLPGEAAGRIP